jgi:hypothetical protein
MVHPYPTAEVYDYIPCSSDVDLSDMAGFDAHPRTGVEVGVGSLRRITPKSGEERIAKENA